MNEFKEVTLDYSDKTVEGLKQLPDGRVLKYTISKPPIKVGDVLRNGRTVLYIQDCDPNGTPGRKWAVIAYKSDIPCVIPLSEAQTLCVV